MPVVKMTGIWLYCAYGRVWIAKGNAVGGIGRVNWWDSNDECRRHWIKASYGIKIDFLSSFWLQKVCFSRWFGWKNSKKCSLQNLAQSWPFRVKIRLIFSLLVFSALKNPKSVAFGVFYLKRRAFKIFKHLYQPLKIDLGLKLNSIRNSSRSEVFNLKECTRKALTLIELAALQKKNLRY